MQDFPMVFNVFSVSNCGFSRKGGGIHHIETLPNIAKLFGGCIPMISPRRLALSSILFGYMFHVWANSGKLGAVFLS